MSGHSCPPGEISSYQVIHTSVSTVQVGVCSCGQVIARRYVITGPGTGPWTVLEPEDREAFHDTRQEDFERRYLTDADEPKEES